MPIYPYTCTECGHTEEMLLEERETKRPRFCTYCSTLMRRAYELQTVQVRGDIEPHYNESLGEYIGSRSHLRERLAHHNAYNPDLMQGSEPKAGRLTREEKAIVEDKSPNSKQTIFERRQQSGWGADSNLTDPRNTDSEVVETFGGEADYTEITDYIKERSANKKGGQK